MAIPDMYAADAMALTKNSKNDWMNADSDREEDGPIMSDKEMEGPLPSGSII